MTNINATELIVNGVTYVPKGTVVCAPVVMGDKRIIVADRGWVFVGVCVDNVDGSVTIHDAQNLRYWGTTRGLGELASGPIPNKTKYDPCGIVRCTPIVQINVVGGW